MAEAEQVWIIVEGRRDGGDADRLRQADRQTERQTTSRPAEGVTQDGVVTTSGLGSNMAAVCVNAE